MVTLGHQRHFIQHLKGGSEVAIIVCFDLEVVCRHQGTLQVTCIVAALLVYFKASATAELQLLQLPSDLLLTLLQLPMMKGTSISRRSPPYPIAFEGLEELRVHTCGLFLHPCEFWLVFMVSVCLSLPHYMSIYLSWPCEHYSRPQHQIPKKLSYTDYRTSIQNYVRSTSCNISLIPDHF